MALNPNNIFELCLVLWESPTILQCFDVASALDIPWVILALLFRLDLFSVKVFILVDRKDQFREFVFVDKHQNQRMRETEDTFCSKKWFEVESWLNGQCH